MEDNDLVWPCFTAHFTALASAIPRTRIQEGTLTGLLGPGKASLFSNIPGFIVICLGDQPLRGPLQLVLVNPLSTRLKQK